MAARYQRIPDGDGGLTWQLVNADDVVVARSTRSFADAPELDAALQADIDAQTSAAAPPGQDLVDEGKFGFVLVIEDAP